MSFATGASESEASAFVPETGRAEAKARAREALEAREPGPSFLGRSEEDFLLFFSLFSSFFRGGLELLRRRRRSCAARRSLAGRGRAPTLRAVLSVVLSESFFPITTAAGSVAAFGQPADRKSRRQLKARCDGEV